MKRAISLDMSEQKLSALEMYLSQRSTSLDAELGKFFEQLYAQYVPKQVREFLALTDTKPERRPRRSAAVTAEQTKQDE